MANSDQAGQLVLGNVFDYYAESINSVYISDQDSNKIVQHDLLTSTERASYQLTGTPGRLQYLASNNTLYTTILDEYKIVAIDLSTGAQEEFTTIDFADALATDGNRIYFTLSSVGANGFALQSLDDQGALHSHGSILGNTIEYNSSTNEIVTTDSGVFPASLYRYSFDSAEQVMLEQITREIFATTDNFAISPDGQQISIPSLADDDVPGSAIYDLSGSDFDTVKGIWDTHTATASFNLINAVAGGFSPAGDLYAASNNDELILFDAKRHNEISSYPVDGSLCSYSHDSTSQIKFSLDGEHALLLKQCPAVDGITVLQYVEAPELPAAPTSSYTQATDHVPI